MKTTLFLIVSFVVLSCKSALPPSSGKIFIRASPNASVAVSSAVDNVIVPVYREGEIFEVRSAQSGVYDIQVTVAGKFNITRQVDLSPGQTLTLDLIAADSVTHDSDAANMPSEDRDSFGIQAAPSERMDANEPLLSSRAVAERFVDTLNARAALSGEAVKWQVGDVLDVDDDGVSEVVVGFWAGGNAGFTDALWQISGDSLLYLQVSDQLDQLGASIRLSPGHLVMLTSLWTDTDAHCCPSFQIQKRFALRNGLINRESVDTVPTAATK